MKLPRALLLACLILSLSACAAPLDETLPEAGNTAILELNSHEQGALLIHGLTATPWEVHELARYLSERNISVYAPVIAGHAGHIKELERSTWQEWVQSAQEAYEQLDAQVRDVYVIGVSVGALLALELAIDQDPAGIVAIAPPFLFKDRRGEYALVAKHFTRYANHSLTPEERGHYFTRIPTQSIGETILLRKDLKPKLPDLDERLLILQSRNDPTVDPKSSTYLYNRAGTSRKRLLWSQDSTHVLTTAREKELVFYNIYQFIRA